jgi:hypothetical protein
MLVLQLPELSHQGDPRSNGFVISLFRCSAFSSEKNQRQCIVFFSALIQSRIEDELS